MGVVQQSTPNLLVCSQHFELIEARPERQFPATTMHCLVTHLHPGVPEYHAPNSIRTTVAGQPNQECQRPVLARLQHDAQDQRSETGRDPERPVVSGSYRAS
jgi:hypothetical protein